MNELSEHEFASPLRGKIFTGIIITVFLAFIGRFVQLQVIEGEALSGAAIEQGLKRIERIPVRGTIYDRYGRVIAASVPAYTVAITRQDFDPYRKETLPLLATILGVDTSFILQRLQKEGGFYTRFQPVKIWRDASPRIIAQIEENYRNLPGVDIIFESKREYVAPIRAAHLLGYTKEISESMLKKLKKTADSDYYHPGDVVGTTGLENVREKELRGVKGYEVLAVDARGQRQSRLNEGATDITAVDGAPIQLGLDIDLQLYAEQLMDGHHGAAVAVDPNNGDILALVSKPDFDLDLFSGKTTKEEYQAVMLDKAHPLFNRALQTKYPPGSTYKMMVGAAALQTGTIDTNYKVVCPGGFTWGGQFYGDHHHGVTDLRKSIGASCNTWYFKMASLMPLDSMWLYARHFGYDTATGVDIGHEGNGVIPNTKRMNKWYPRGWTKGYVISQGVGQGEVSVTPVQQAAYAGVWANRGLWVQPHAAKRIWNAQKGTWDSVPYKTRQVPVKAEYLEILRQGMYYAVNIPGGTSRAAIVPDVPWQAAGKTGTAQNPHGEDHAWFVCFAPYDKPKIAICVMVENAGFGGVVSAPIARKLMNLYLTGRREDPLPTILPNTDEYRALKEAKYSKDKAIAAAAAKKVGTLAPAPNAATPKPAASTPKPAPAKPTPAKPTPTKPAPAKPEAKPKPTAEAILPGNRRG
ncbi:MAG TPA: penicillin-binding protein 2 [Candidatus Kapabacteria bacterium]|nr:penicillin-binding protein 2 [Candidatus Kapabacteria bacterium]